MEATVGDFLLQRLAAWGVRRVYGYPGDDIIGIMGAFGRTEEEIEFVQTRHEEMAAIMACAWSRW
jgi:pyruvate dehydrogenase (quinone)